MKSNMNENKECSTLTTFLVMGTLGLMWLLGIMFLPTAGAQEIKKSEWIEQTVVEIPYTVEINEGVTRNGNPKYWIEIENTNVVVSEGNYKKFINKEVKLVLVEWYNPTTDKYKYTTRQADKAKSNNKLNIDELW